MRPWDIWRFAHPIISTEQDYHFQILENNKLNCAIALFKLVSTKKRDCHEATPNRRFDRATDKQSKPPELGQLIDCFLSSEWRKEPYSKEK
jgi:hypothetical protein